MDLSLIERASRPPSKETIDHLSNNPIISFVSAAYSFPHDWWLAIHWILGLQGLYGSLVKENSLRIARDLDTVIALGVKASPNVYSVTAVTLDFIFTGNTNDCPAAREVLSQIDRNQLGNDPVDVGSRMTGRYAGGLFTLYASTGGRFGSIAQVQPQKTGFVFSNLMLASVGAIIKLIIKNGATITVVDMWSAILTGSDRPVLTPEQYKKLFRAIQSCNLSMDKANRRHFDGLHQNFAKESRRLQ